ncbi:MAG: 23S rRNA (guanosine(2251)-2'-O)-methyltransferase RlmB [Acidobacteria bacterium]|nr:23S rRNA (guanosine(2251)-2'-O)-methyltransferase RlmB [Acidobacteriota bacterium]
MSAHLIGVHAVTEALRAGRDIHRVIIARGRKSGPTDVIVEECRRRGITPRFESRESLDRLVQTEKHQGVVAVVSGGRAQTLEQVLDNIAGAGLIVVLDGVQDPHNLGAVVRSAHAAGADAVVIPERRSAGITEVAAKASAGAVEYIPVISVKNINHALDQLKKNRFWLYGLDERGSQSYLEADYAGNVGLVLGSEGNGLHRLTAEKCDFLVRIPIAGPIASLNVSVAAGVALFEIIRRRGQSD